MGDAALLRAPPIVPAPPPRGQMDAPQVSRRHGPHRHRRRDRPGAARGRAQAGPPDAWGCWASGRRGAPRLPLCAQAIRPGCRRRRRRRRRSCSAALRCDAPHAPARRNRARNLSACARSMRTARVPTWPQQAGGGGGRLTCGGDDCDWASSLHRLRSNSSVVDAAAGSKRVRAVTSRPSASAEPPACGGACM
jgi:hypothetical protein